MFQVTPLNPTGDDGRNRIMVACRVAKIGNAPFILKYDHAVGEYDDTHRGSVERERCLDSLSEIFCNFIESGRGKSIESLRFLDAVASGDVFARLHIGAAISSLLLVPKVSERELTMREDIAISFVQELLRNPLVPSSTALQEIDTFVRKAPGFLDRLIAFERANSLSVVGKELSIEEVRYIYRLNETAIIMLRLVVENNMPADVAMKATEAMALIQRNSDRNESIEMWKWFVHSSVCSSMLAEPRLPDPLGRSAFMGAFKSTLSENRNIDIGSQRSVHHFPVSLPTNMATWKYFGQRVTALAAIKDPIVRSERLFGYLASFREFVAAHPFYAQEEQYFRQGNLDGKMTLAQRKFYTNVYGVDNTPAVEDSDSAKVILGETAKAFRTIAAARYGLNVRKGYARSLSSGKWLLESMAEELQGSAQRLHVKDIEAYPGPGVRISGLRVQNALDLSTSESRRFYLKTAPWIASSIRAGAGVEYYLFRGFKAITRSLEAGARPMSPYWIQHGSFNGEPYSAIIFNDHFHNNLLPEVRMWLVPERVLHRKMMFAVENGVDINRLDVTPEGIAEETAALGLVVFDVGSSCVRWGSFANAWPHGEGPAHSWEDESEWGFSRWQSTRHIHRALVDDQYHTYLTRPVAQVMAKARVQHDEIKRRVHFFLDLHSSFLTMEEAWAKGYANAEEAPATPEMPQQQELEGHENPEEQERSEEDVFWGAPPTRPRTRMLKHFLELRNQIVNSGKPLTLKDLPSLELQYTRLFARQADSPYISGADMMLILPEGRQISLLPGKPHQGTIYKKIVEMDERMEALWDEHIVSRFAPNNCPRIILP